MKKIQFRIYHECQNGHGRFLYKTVTKEGIGSLWGSKKTDCDCPTFDFGEGFTAKGEPELFTNIVSKGQVYEGSVLHFPNMEEYVDVFYNEGAFWVLFEKDDEPTLLTQKLIEANYATVAGNIHDNPDG